MPYINQEDRMAYDLGLQEMPFVRTPGQLNYIITKLVHKYLERFTPPSYAVYNEVIGVLECAKLELYRRWVAPYEDQKMHENGDVT